jgi:hypothetical protein
MGAGWVGAPQHRHLQQEIGGPLGGSHAESVGSSGDCQSAEAVGFIDGEIVDPQLLERDRVGVAGAIEQLLDAPLERAHRGRDALAGNALGAAVVVQFVQLVEYPTEWGIAQLRQFRGTPHQFVGLVVRMWWEPTPLRVDAGTDDGKPVMVIRMATGGWSGNEQLVGVVEASFFGVLYWQSSCRGGLHVYHVPLDAGTAQ